MKLVIYIQILNAIPLNATLLNDQQKFELNKINEITYYFVAEIKQKELMSKRLSKYITSFDYFAKPLIVLSVPSGSISIDSFAYVIGEPVGITSASFSPAFSIFTGIVKKLLKRTKNKNKNKNKLLC